SGIGVVLGDIFGSTRPRGTRLSTGQVIAREVTRSVSNRVAGQVAADIGKSIGGKMGSSVGRAIVRGTMGGILRRGTRPPPAPNGGIRQSLHRGRLILDDTGSLAAFRRVSFRG